MMRAPLVIHGLWGLGDNVYSRPFIRAAAATFDVHLRSPWPELYSDLPIRFVRQDARLRTQQKNTERQPPWRWSNPPKSAREFRVTYGAGDFLRGSLIDGIARKFALFGIVSDLDPFDLPDLGPCPIANDRPIAIVKAATLRKEWLSEARNPLPCYVDTIARILAEHYEVIAVADTDGVNEWLDGSPPFAHRSFLHGELLPTELLALCRHAAVVVGGVGWNVPVTIAMKVPSFVILGGLGGHNHPSKITDPRLDLFRIAFAMPARFCLCTKMRHSCQKEIPDLFAQFKRFAERHGLRLPDDSPLNALPGGPTPASVSTRLQLMQRPFTAEHISTDSLPKPTATSAAT
jgi:hypothetical protein